MKTAFVTGAATGIGLATATKLARQGWKVGLFDINQEGINKLLERSEFAEACGGFCGVSDRGSIEGALALFSEHTNGHLDLLVNNAAVLSGGPFELGDAQANDAMVEVNVKGLTNVAQLAFPLLKETPGATMVNLCSTSSVHGIPLIAVYSATKFYVNGLTKALNLEWKEHDIHVTCVKPPVVQTSMGSQKILRNLSQRPTPVPSAPHCCIGSTGGVRQTPIQ
ncbi:SDR family NAD(P)-dependent oxidoreductase [Phaeobacter marinintestinus]|uniref:SDR family NAD(P)-dependent oxidoreductase n=1 Tax=Falsiphaeobacter marinintestinus TaxID=1492905 RepID=UPI0011B388C5|nr:SDR family NAD(P)-dependent oxidoreductase [Phaeobacter marinintestinus]